MAGPKVQRIEMDAGLDNSKDEGSGKIHSMQSAKP